MFIPAKNVDKFWCPMARTLAVDPDEPGANLPANRVYNIKTGDVAFAPAACIGVMCAAWRFSPPLSTRRFIPAKNADAMNEEESGSTVLPSDGVFEFQPWDGGDIDDAPAGFTETTESAVSRSVGYCGMAGKPKPY